MKDILHALAVLCAAAALVLWPTNVAPAQCPGGVCRPTPRPAVVYYHVPQAVAVSWVPVQPVQPPVVWHVPQPQWQPAPVVVIWTPHGYIPTR